MTERDSLDYAGQPQSGYTSAAECTTKQIDPRVERALAVNDYLARHPVVEAANFDQCQDHGSTSIKVNLSATSFKTGKKQSYRQSFVCTDDGKHGKYIESSLETTPDEIKVSTRSPAGGWTVNLRDTEIKDRKRRFIEILHDDTGIHDEIDVTDLHSDFLSGEHWGQPCWLPGEDILVYAAEHHAPNWKDDDKPYTAYEYAPNFGEQLSSQTRPGLFLLDFSSASDGKVYSVSPLIGTEALPSTVFRQPTLAPRDSPTMPIVAYATGSSLLPNGRRLGSIYCSNRPDAIYELTIPVNLRLEGNTITARRVSDSNRSAHYPRVLPLGARHSVLVYVSNKLGFEHSSCATLHKRALPLELTADNAKDVLVDVVGTPANSNAFPGLYPDFFAGNCLLSLSESSKECAKSFMVLQSCWASRTVILTVNLEDGTVNKHDSDPITSWKPLATDGAKRLLAIRSSTISPPELMLGTFSAVNELSIDWVTVKSWNYSFKENLHFAGIRSLHSTVVSLPRWHATQAIVISGQNFDYSSAPSYPRTYRQKLPGLETASQVSFQHSPLVYSPHGGPCSQYSASWNLGGSVAWVAAGFTVAYINYPGSLGFGQDTIDELSKDCGNLEVRACIELKNYLVKIGIAPEDSEKHFFLGGSHSGFIGAHISARWPKEFHAIDIRNPVIDLPSMFATSDIPDWTLRQFNLEYDFNCPPSFVPENAHEEMRKRSPSRYAVELFACSKGPCMPRTLLQIGAVDMRVPPTQGKAWYHCLKGHGEDVSMLVYPENGHPIDKVWAKQKTLKASLEHFLNLAKSD